MNIPSAFESRVRLRSEIASGDVFCRENGEISQDLDGFALHDSLIYGLEICCPLDREARVVVSGLLPSWQETFDLVFLGVSGLVFNNLDMSKGFGISELKCRRVAHLVEVEFVGEFDGQTFSFTAAAAQYKKFRLDSALSRSEMGWT